VEKSVHIVVKGLVQGVGFRWFVREAAHKSGLVGWVKNLPTGEVELEAEGESSHLETFIQAVRIGPMHAHVRDLRIEYGKPKHQFDGFDIVP
jgi:acylphosphatase